MIYIFVSLLSSFKKCEHLHSCHELISTVYLIFQLVHIHQVLSRKRQIIKFNN